MHPEKHEKCLETNTVTQTTFCDKNESHPLFYQSVTQLTTVKLGFDQIRTMTTSFVCLGFRCSLLFLVLFLASQASAKQGNNANSTPVSSPTTKHCNNVYQISFYAGPNKKIETILQEIKKQLTQLQDDIDVLKGNKTTVKGEICFLLNCEFCLLKLLGFTELISSLFLVHLRLCETDCF